MTLLRRLTALERARRAPANVLSDLLASIAARGVTIHQRDPGAVLGDPMPPERVAAWLDALARSPSPHPTGGAAMTLKSRLNALERAVPGEDGGVVIVWHTVVTPPGGPLNERLASAWIAPGPGGDGLQLRPEEGEASDAFEARALAEAQRIHERSDAAWREAVRWNPEPTRAG